jgi:predicted nucleic acid-binding protein
MNGFGLDTNIISFRLKRNELVKRNIDQRVDSKVKVLVPPFVYYEIKRGLADTKAIRQIQLFDELLKRCPVGPISHAVFETAVDIYVELKSKGRLCDENDIYIAAWCKTYGLTLVTNNTRHFEQISGLSLVDWSQEPKDD